MKAKNLITAHKIINILDNNNRSLSDTLEILAMLMALCRDALSKGLKDHVENVRNN